MNYVHMYMVGRLCNRVLIKEQQLYVLHNCLEGVCQFIIQTDLCVLFTSCHLPMLSLDPGGFEHFIKSLLQKVVNFCLTLPWPPLNTL